LRLGISPALDSFLKTQQNALRLGISPALDSFLKTQQNALRLGVGKLDSKAAFRVALTGLQNPSALVVDDALGALERAVEDVGRQLDTEGTTLLAVWAESLRDFRSWLLEPAIKWPAIGLMSFLVAYWWVTLKTEHPDVADAVEVPFSVFAGLLLTMAASARKK
ncbi:hypothetical protein KBX37_29940, partial [Micromonospora sp. U56]|uniref:hypothetical protein n=1 Tax=Micromonospora sp. U56 TaxID=2824900 RepID=UPI001B35FBCB